MSGRNRRGRDVMGVGLAALNRLADLTVIDKLGLRKQTEKAVYEASKAGFRTVTTANRTFAKVQGRGAGKRPSTSGGSGLFDLSPTDEQKMIVEATAEFAAEQLRPAAAEADAQCLAPDTVVKRSITELGISQLGVPESLGGMAGERSVTTGALVAEALAHGDMGLAVAILAPAGVANALVLWGDESQQQTYLPSFVGDEVPAAAVSVVEPHPLFDPFTLKTTARRTSGGYVLDGVKSLVPRAAQAELFVVESGTSGILVESEPAMGLRAASTGRLILDGVTVPSGALLGEGSADVYADAIRLSRIGWASLACGTGKAVLDYVIPYVNDRKAFGEPISNRQAVAFMVANIAIELEGARLTTLRAAARAEQGKSFARETALARRLTAEYGMQIGSSGVQLLGGHGYVKEHPVERWYRDLRSAAVMEGVVLV